MWEQYRAANLVETGCESVDLSVHLSNTRREKLQTDLAMLIDCIEWDERIVIYHKLNTVVTYFEAEYENFLPRQFRVIIYFHPLIQHYKSTDNNKDVK
jgi:hypothetical protein